jgi:hypothetical protein
MKGKSKNGKGKREKRVKVNILTIFLFNEAYAEPDVEFLSSLKSNLFPHPLLPSS